jgi:hypothetical protein
VIQPTDPITAMAAAAIQLHEMYEAFVAAGFTREQAFELTKATLLNGSGV